MGYVIQIRHWRENQLFKNIGIVYLDKDTLIVQEFLNKIKNNAVIAELCENIWHFKITIGMVTCITDVLDIHIDHPKLILILSENMGFLETRVMILISFYIPQILKIHL